MKYQTLGLDTANGKFYTSKEKTSKSVGSFFQLLSTVAWKQFIVKTSANGNFKSASKNERFHKVWGDLSEMQFAKEICLSLFIVMI